MSDTNGISLVVRQRNAIQDARIAFSHYIGAYAKQNKEVHPRIPQIASSIAKLEKDIEKIFPVFLEDYPIWESWLMGIKGIGSVYASELLAGLDIHKAPYPSSFWKYCGVGVEPNGERQRRRKGEKTDFNPHMKKTLWKIAVGFRKNGGFYKELYEKFKEEEKVKHPEKIKVNGKTSFNDSHLRNRALRKTAKIFLAHLHAKWREVENLPPVQPYVHQHMGHQHFIEAPESG